MKTIINKQYQLIHKLHEDFYGDQYLAKDTNSGQHVSVKLESRYTWYPSLYHESKLLQHLSGTKGISEFIGIGCHGDYTWCATELVGENLEKCLISSGGKFPLQTVLLLADQMLLVIEALHHKQ